jgi:hypothetical protein
MTTYEAPTELERQAVIDAELAAEGDAAFAVEKRIKSALADGRRALWALSEALYEFDELCGWPKLGYKTKSEWLADPEISITSATYYRLVKLWREFVLRHKVALPALGELEPSKVDIVLGRLRSHSVTLEQAINDVKTQGWRDLREVYYDRPEPPPSEADVSTEAAPAPGPVFNFDEPELDEPVPADELREAEPVASVEDEPVVGSVLDDAGLWRAKVQAAFDELKGVQDTVSFPRVSRSTAEVCIALLGDWLAKTA